MRDISSIPIRQLVAGAWALRSEFQLDDVGYGRIHWGNQTDVLTSPFSYYYFLAGLARYTGATRVLEIGTHQGGSTRAIVRGLSDPAQSRVVTFDVSPFGAQIFSGDPVVRAFTMDANSEGALRKCVDEFGGQQVDVAFIDSTHDFWTTLQSFALCSSILDCRLIVLDDVSLNDSMAGLWDLIKGRYGEENAINAVEVDAAIRTGGDGTTPGFGVVRLPHPD